MTSRPPSTAWVTPLPPYRSPPSRSSTASKAPVEAPLGTAARAIVPSSRATSTSTVGFPRESRISRAPTASMLGTGASLTSPAPRAVTPRSPVFRPTEQVRHAARHRGVTGDRSLLLRSGEIGRSGYGERHRTGTMHIDGPLGGGRRYTGGTHVVECCGRAGARPRRPAG